MNECPKTKTLEHTCAGSTMRQLPDGRWLARCIHCLTDTFAADQHSYFYTVNYVIPEEPW